MTDKTEQDPFKLSISQFLLEEAQFRHTGEFLAQPPNTPVPSIPVELEIQTQLSRDDNKCAVRLRVVSESLESPYSYTIVYLVLLSYEGQEPDDLDRRMAVTGATMVMPFVRELVANLSSRARFGTTWLGPINFSQSLGEATNKPGD